MKAFTDYPFEFLGDEPRQLAPIREVTVLSYDGDKYAEIEVDGHRTSVKAGYLYVTPGRLGEVEAIITSELPIIG
jgi:hypothetical protein